MAPTLAPKYVVIDTAWMLGLVSVQEQSSLRAHAVWHCPLLSRLTPGLLLRTCQIVSALRAQDH